MLLNFVFALSLSLSTLFFEDPVLVTSVYEKADGDKVVAIETALIDDETLKDAEQLSDLSYEVQEAVHAVLKEEFGTEVDYFYIWIEVNGTSILAVDPPKTMF